MVDLSSLVSPVSVLFIAIILGGLLGRIKVFGISMDLAGILVVAVLLGCFLTKTDYFWNMDLLDYQADMKTFSSFGTALFVSVIGLSAGFSLDLKSLKNAKAIVIGAFMSASAFVIMKLILLFDVKISVSKMLGAFCGALTTTPGLSAVCELKNIEAEEAILGYGCTYLIGVIFTVLFVQIATKKTVDKANNNFSSIKTLSPKNTIEDINQISIVVLIGYLFGNIKFSNYSLGNSGGILCAGIVIGLVIKKWLPKNIADKKTLDLLRNLGLAIFFVGNGVPAGIQIVNGFDIELLVYGALFTIVPIAIGAILFKVFFSDGLVATIIAGGMTSTPAISMLIKRNSNINIVRYSFAYVGALITTIILLRF